MDRFVREDIANALAAERLGEKLMKPEKGTDIQSGERPMDPKTQAYLMQEVPKGEALLQEYGEESPEARKVILPSLTQMYGLLNQRLAQIAVEMNYGLDQNQWSDSKPLEKMNREMPGIAATNWYQHHLGEIMIKTGHPWVNLIMTSPKPSPSA